MKVSFIKISKMAAFSLIELMVVIAIVAILAAVAVPSYKGYLVKSSSASVNDLITHSMETWSLNFVAGTTPATLLAPIDGVVEVLFQDMSGIPLGASFLVVFVDSDAFFGSAFADNHGHGGVIAAFTATNTGDLISWQCGLVTIAGNQGDAHIGDIATNFIPKYNCTY